MTNQSPPPCPTDAPEQVGCVVRLMLDGDALVQATATTTFAALWRPVLELLLRVPRATDAMRRLRDDWVNGLRVVGERLRGGARVALKNYLGCVALAKSVLLAFLPATEDECCGESLAVTAAVAAAPCSLVPRDVLRSEATALYSFLKSLLLLQHAGLPSSHLQVVLAMLGSVAAQREYALSTFTPALLDLVQQRSGGRAYDRAVFVSVRHTARRVLADIAKSYFPVALEGLRARIADALAAATAEERHYIADELHRRAAGRTPAPAHRRRENPENSYLPTLDDDDSDDDDDDDDDDEEEEEEEDEGGEEKNENDDDNKGAGKEAQKTGLEPPAKAMRLDTTLPVAATGAGAAAAAPLPATSAAALGAARGAAQLVVTRAPATFGARVPASCREELDALLPGLFALQQADLVGLVMNALLAGPPLPTTVVLPHVHFWGVMTHNVAAVAAALIPGWSVQQLAAQQQRQQQQQQQQLQLQLQQQQLQLQQQQQQQQQQRLGGGSGGAQRTAGSAPLTREELVALRQQITARIIGERHTARALHDEVLCRTSECFKETDAVFRAVRETCALTDAPTVGLRILFRAACDAVPAGGADAAACAAQEATYARMLAQVVAVVDDPVRLLLRAPWIPDAVLEAVDAWAADADHPRHAHAFPLLQALVAARQPCAAKCLARLKRYAGAHARHDSALHEAAVACLAKLHAEGGALADDIEHYATELVVAHYRDNNNKSSKSSSNSSTGGAGTTDEETASSLSLFLAICASSPVLMGQLFRHYAQGTDALRRGLLNSCRRVLDSLCSARNREATGLACLAMLLRNAPPACRELTVAFLRTLVLQGAGHADAVAEAVAVARALFAQWRDPLPLTVTAPVLPRAALLELLPRVVAVAAPQQLREFLVMVDPHVLSPPDVLVHLHQLALPAPVPAPTPAPAPADAPADAHDNGHEDAHELLRALARAVPICLEVHAAVLTQPVVAALLQRLAAWPVLSPLLMRTALLCLRRYPRLRNWFLQALLPALLRRRVHESRPLWAGFVLCCTRIGPDACPVLLQADRAALTHLIAASPDVRRLLADYAKRRSLPVDIQRLITDSVASQG